jgi:carbon-monoxide dehydrogenase large subunit
VPQNVGDVEAAFASADRVWKETFRIHRCAGNPMETRGVLADCDPVSRQITLYSSTQHAHLTKLYLAGVLGVSDSTIRVVAPDIGGGFGVKEAFYCEEALAPIASLRLGRPVQWIEDRREHLTGAYQAREQVHHVEIAASKDGVILGAKMRGYTAIGAAYATIGNTPGAIASAMMLGPYRIPNFRSEQFNVVTNKPPLNVYRGAGHPQAVLCMERMMDIAAQDLGLDPAEIRRRNFIQPDQFPLDRQMGFVGNDRVIYDSGDYPRCLELALEAAHYNDFPQRQAEARKAGRYLGLGLSFFVEVTAVGPYETATIRVDGAGKVTLLTGIQPIGQGIVTAITQLVAEELGVEMEDVTVVFGDTSLIPDAVGTFASRGGAIGGAAARLAAVKIKDKARRIAGHLLEVGEDDLEWSGSRVQVKGAPTKGFTLAELSQKATAWNPVSALPEGMDFNLECTHHYQVSKSAYANACHVAVVDVDVETGRVKVVDYTVAHDCGRVINPMIVEGQVIGGVAQGLGGTIHEEMVFDAQGRPTSTSWMDYLLPVASDIPFINIVHQETPAPDNPYGMKGAGEGGTTGAPAALVNAIQNALEPFGVRINDDGPFSPANILKRLSLAKEKAA